MLGLAPQQQWQRLQLELLNSHHIGVFVIGTLGVYVDEKNTLLNVMLPIEGEVMAPNFASYIYFPQFELTI